MDLPVLSQPLPRGFADNLQRPTCDGRHAPADLGVLVGLLLLCLLPRAIVAWRMPAVCNDAVLYIRLADSFRNGNVSEGLHAIRLNLFPILLAGVHCLGFDWELGGKLWGVLISSCTVLPLYGWTRRQFDERVALVTCFLYSIHWELVRWSPEIIRDPTFWFLFTLGLYLLWRAVAEVRLTLFVAAGLAVALASLTRCEGLFLLLPLVLWSITRWQALQQCRCRLAVGVLLCVGAFPMLIAVLALGWLREHALSELVRLEPLSWIYWWAHTGLSPLVGGQDVPIPVLCDATGVISLGRMIEVYVPTLVKGITPVFGLLILAGIGGGWRAVWRRDHRAMLYTTLLFFLAIWIHLWTAHGSCKRYFLTIVVITTPVAAMGLITTTSVLVRMAQRHAWPGGTRALTCCLPLPKFR
ncbi:MAG: glycosyltransferase family 39 protein [Thermoguttaceae bacterium]